MREPGSKNALVVPYVEDREKIIKEYHLGTGHGRLKTLLYYLNKRYKWQGMKQEIENALRKCEICQREEKVKAKKTCFPSNILEPNKRWELDLVGPLEQRFFILTAIDVFSKIASCRVLRDKSAHRVLKAFENIVKSRGTPERS